MWKKILPALLLLLVLAACGTDGDTDGGTEGQTAQEPATLQVGLLGTSIKPVGVLTAQALGYFEIGRAHV